VHLLEHSPRRTFASDSPMMYWLVRVQQLGATDEKEVQRVRGRDCLGEERLVRAWRPYNSEVSSERVRGYEHIL